MTACLSLTGAGLAQIDSVDVMFYYRPSGHPSTVYLPGEFNGWVLNSRSAMTWDLATSRWTKTVRLRVGGPVPLPWSGSIAGAYQYKFNENGSSGGWTQDPMNPRQNPVDNNNSYLFIRNPTIHYLLPNSVSGLVRTNRPQITAYLFPSVSTQVDTGSIRLSVDGVEYGNLGRWYDPVTKFFRFLLPHSLSNGTHTMMLEAFSSSGTSGSDSTSFLTQGGFAQILTQSDPRCLRPVKTIEGIIEDTTVVMVTLFHNGESTVPDVECGCFSEEMDLEEGANAFFVTAEDSLGFVHQSDTVTIQYFIDHSPRPSLSISETEGRIEFCADGNDPDGDLLDYVWTSDEVSNPQSLDLVAEGSVASASLPQVPGDYFVDLRVVDPDSNVGTTRGMFKVGPDSSIHIPTVDENPGWVRKAVVYEIFMPSFTPEGTFRAAAERLDWIQSLGANTVWLMPIYENGETINEGNAGYNITDFYTVHPQLGSMADFEFFVEEAHARGLRVILDSTPNHVSAEHPWVKDVEFFHEYANSRPFLETQILGDNRGMGQYAIMDDGYTVWVHYTNWGLANLDYATIETFEYMRTLYNWWVLEKKIDGYRMDVYWGPQNRYGKNVWWRPFREEIKRVRPDVFILGETDGTGQGSENNYADRGGASDAAYDWNFFNLAKSALGGCAISDLDDRVRNYSPDLFYNHYTGENAHYFRFLENHDESRIASLYTFSKARAGAVLLMTVPGIPMIYAGQEVGETSRRGPIQWNRIGGSDVYDFYQRLIGIRNRFETFRSSEIKRISTDHSRVYSYLRPFLDQNAITVINFSASSVTALLNVNPSDLRVDTDSVLTGKVYYLNDVLNDTSWAIAKSDLGHLDVNLPPWSSMVFVFSDSLFHFDTGIGPAGPVLGLRAFSISQNFPNPFNATTTFLFTLGEGEPSWVTAKVYNVLGKQIKVLLHEIRKPGSHALFWDGTDQDGRSAAAGLYFCRIESRGIAVTVKMALIK